MRDLYLDLRHPLLEVEWERAKLLLTEFLRLWVCPAQHTIYVVGIVRNMYFSYEITSIMIGYHCHRTQLIHQGYIHTVLYVLHCTYICHNSYEYTL